MQDKYDGWAFNRGCDARIAGKPMAANPFGEGDQFTFGWNHGWLDVDRNWGSDSRHPVRPLPEITGVRL